LRVARVPWADACQRSRTPSPSSLCELAGSAVAHHFRLNWGTIATVVEGAVLRSLQHRRWEPLHLIGIDEVSRRKGQKYVTIVYDLSRGRVVWIGRDRDTATIERFFAWLGSRRARAIHTVCCTCGVSTSTPPTSICRGRRSASIGSTSASI
jgi:hypothetical protein